MRLPAALDSFAAEPVTFLHARRQKERRRSAIGTKHFAQKRKRCDPINIVVAVEDNLFPGGNSPQDSIDGVAHLREQKRIAQAAQSRPQKFLRLNVIEEAPPLQKSRDTGKSTDLSREIRERGGFGRGDPTSCPSH